MKNIISIIIIGILFFNGIGTNVSSEYDTIQKQTSKIEEYDMVIISPALFSEALQPLINHKNSVGIRTLLKMTEEIYDEYDGRDKPEQIKYCIKDVVETYHIKYVLLVGGRVGQSFQWYIPPRYSHVDDGFMHKEFLSDLYYADIYDEQMDFEDWDSNVNNIFSEWYVDESKPHDVMDLKPDVSLGRLPCRYEQEVEIVVEKIIEYALRKNIELSKSSPVPYRFKASLVRMNDNADTRLLDKYINMYLEKAPDRFFFESLR